MVRRRAVVLSVVALVGLLGAAGCSGGEPDALDVAAAKACRAVRLGQEASTAAVLLDLGKPLNVGKEEAAAAGKPAPRWAALGSVLDELANDIDAKDAVAFADDQARALALCKAVPADAERSVGDDS